MAIFGSTFAAAQVSSVLIGSIVPVLAWRLAADVAEERGLAVGRARTLAIGTGIAAGYIFNALFAKRREGKILYDPRFTNDRFGIFVPTGTDSAAKIESLLKDSGADEVRRG